MKIIYIDGHCNLCNGLIKYLHRSRPDLFSFGKTSFNNNLDYIVYSRDGKLFKAEKAVLMIGRDMGGIQKNLSDFELNSHHYFKKYLLLYLS